LIVDEPTQGIDVGAKAEIHALLRELAGRGVGILMVSSDLPKVLGMCDRIVVMAGGRVRAVLAGKDATEEQVIEFAAARGATPSARFRVSRMWRWLRPRYTSGHDRPRDEEGEPP
jgi:ABC-type multidrug transport system ATPase subunit